MQLKAITTQIKNIAEMEEMSCRNHAAFCQFEIGYLFKELLLP